MKVGVSITFLMWDFRLHNQIFLMPYSTKGVRRDSGNGQSLHRCQGTSIKDVQRFWTNLPTYVRFILFSILYLLPKSRFLLRDLPTPKSDVLYGRSLKQLNFAPHFSCVCNLMSFFFLFSFFFHFKDVEIALVGKYTKLEDAYASVIKALNHASLALNHRLRQEEVVEEWYSDG